MCAIVSGGAIHLNQDLIARAGVSGSEIDAVIASESVELERRERLYRGSRPMVPLAGRTVIVVDDGIATGATMHAALNALRAHHPARLVVAVPVAPADEIGRAHV